ncbi:hypothetical protein Tco_1517436 [Tanacetum coccineum]
MVSPNKLGPDLNGKVVNETQYRGFDLKGYSDSDYAGCNMDRKSTLGACQLLVGKLVPTFCDNTSVIAISNNPVLHSRTKHIDIRYHFIRDRILKGDIELHFIPTKYQLVDIFTKPLDEPTFKRLIVELEPFTKSLNMYKEYLAKFWYSAKALENSKVSFSVPTSGIYGKVGVNTFRNAIGAHYLPHSSEYVAPPSIDIVRPWFETIGYGETVPAKGTLKKSLRPPSLANGINIDYASIFWEDIIIKLNKRHRGKNLPYTRFLSLLMMHKMKEGYRDAKPVVFKAPKPSSNAERVPQCTKPGHKKHSTSSKQPYVSSSKATKGGSSKAPTGSKTGHLKRKKESSSAMDSNPSQTLAFTLVVVEMHKED